MEFEINGNKWKIIEVPQEDFWEYDGELDKMNKREYYFGRCHFDLQTIWLWKDQSEGQKKKTLYHELMHCYRGSFLSFSELDNQPEDVWCDLVANSHDIITKIVEDYFKNRKGKVEWKITNVK